LTLFVGVENLTIPVSNSDVTDVSNPGHVILSDILTTELPRRIDGTRSNTNRVFPAVDAVSSGRFDQRP
jgi:hypothetical protein